MDEGLLAGNEWLKPGAMGSLSKGCTDQKRRGFRPATGIYKQIIEEVEKQRITSKF
jgi:hypothetical protein